LLRYRTGDLARLNRTPTPVDDGETSWRTSVKMSKIVGRADDMLIVRGVNLFPSSVEAILHSFPEVVEYRLIARKQAAIVR